MEISKSKSKNTKTEKELSRRKILKKVAYITPVIVGLGMLTTPTIAGASETSPIDDLIPWGS